jgi:hypothetical protein
LKSRPAFSRNHDWCTPKRARADRYLRAGALGLLPKLREFFNGRGKVGIGEQGPFSPAFEHAVPHGVALAAIARIAQHPQTGIFALKLPGNLRGAVGRSVIDYQHLGEQPITEFQVLDYLLQCSGQPFLFVVGRNDNGD